MNEQKLIPTSHHDASFCKINGKTFTRQEFQPHEWGVSIRVEFDRWADFDKNDFNLLKIEFFKSAPKPSLSWTTKIIEHSYREVDNHGHTYDVTDSVCIQLPFSDFIEYLGQEVEVSVKVL